MSDYRPMSKQEISFSTVPCELMTLQATHLSMNSLLHARAGTLEQCVRGGTFIIFFLRGLGGRIRLACFFQKKIPSGNYVHSMVCVIL